MFWHGSLPSQSGHTHPVPAATVLGATVMTYLGNFARTGDPNSASNGGESLQLAGQSEHYKELVLPQWLQHAPRAERLMALGGSGGTDGVPAKLTSLPAEVGRRFVLLADVYFARVVPRQLGEGQQGHPDQQQMVPSRGGWTGRRRQRL